MSSFYASRSDHQCTCKVQGAILLRMAAAPAHVSLGLSADSTSNANMGVSIDSHLEVEDAEDVLRGFGPWPERPETPEARIDREISTQISKPQTPTSTTLNPGTPTRNTGNCNTPKPQTLKPVCPKTQTGLQGVGAYSVVALNGPFNPLW